MLNGNYTFGENDHVIPKTDGSYDSTVKVNTPDTSKLPTTTTKYVTWDEENGTYNEQLSSEVPDNWYDYNNGQWANIKTTSTDNSLEAYWVWIPRFAYKLPESSSPKQIEVAFVKNDSKTVVQADGTEVEGYYATDSEITTGGTGLYTAATDLAKGTNGQQQAWIIHPAFTFGDKQLNGIWFAKYEASSTEPDSKATFEGKEYTVGGKNSSEDIQVQVKPGVTAWRGTQTANSFKVCRAMQDTGGVVGTETGTTTIDTHMTKNMEWAAVSVLSQSKYGVFNPESTNGGKIWNNPNNEYITGAVAKANNSDATSLAPEDCDEYNTGNGPKGSTTGTVYGVYDMAGCAWEHVMGIMENASGSGIPMTSSTGFNDTNAWPGPKYFDIYAYGTTDEDQIAYDRGKIGDLTRELNPAAAHSWNSDYAYFVCPTWPLVARGGAYWDGAKAGMFVFHHTIGNDWHDAGFRPVLVII